MDVTLCTASILHLCSISMDRYYAIVNQPLLYNQRITNTRVALAIVTCYALSALTGFVPIFTGIYTSNEHLERFNANFDVPAAVNRVQCDLVVNKWFSVLAGAVSFWVPASIMVKSRSVRFNPMMLVAALEEHRMNEA